MSPCSPFRIPFCSYGSRLFSSGNLYNNPETMTLFISFQISRRSEIGLKFSTAFPFFRIFYTQIRSSICKSLWKSFFVIQDVIHLFCSALMKTCGIFKPGTLHLILVRGLPVAHLSTLISNQLRYYQIPLFLILQMIPDVPRSFTCYALF